MIARVLRYTALAASVVTANCSNGATASTPAVTPLAIAGEAKLQFAVGTATIGYPGGSITGTNFVSTFRSAGGLSATLSNTPTITGPSTFAIGFPGSSNTIGGALPNVFNGAVLASASGVAFPFSAFSRTLGPYVGVFGYGMAGDNLVSTQTSFQYSVDVTKLATPCYDLDANGQAAGTMAISDPIGVAGGQINGQPYVGSSISATSQAQSHELGLPLGYAQGTQGNGLSTSCANYPLSGIPAGAGGSLPINYYGGPPAWPAPQGYGQPTFFLGYPLGFTDFAATPVAGSYSLDVAYPTNSTSTTYGHIDATATLHNVTPLPPIVVNSATVNNDGSGTVTVNVPAGVTEAVIMARTINCSHIAGQQNFANYAIVTHAAGQQSVQFAPNLGAPDASGQPSKTFCGGETLAFAVGFDYTAYESSYPFDVSQTPTITNATGQADVTTSAPLAFSNIPSTVP